MHIAASAEVSVGSAKGKTVISGGSIISDSREKISSASSPYGAPLEEVRRECSESFSEEVSFGGNKYTYTASPFRDDGFVSVYLPVGYETK